MYSWLLNPVGGRNTKTHDDAHHSGKSTGSQFLTRSCKLCWKKRTKIKMKETRFQEVIQTSVTLVHLLNPPRIENSAFLMGLWQRLWDHWTLAFKICFLKSWSSTKLSKNRDLPKLYPNLVRRGRFKHDRYSPYLCTMMCRKTDHLNEGCLHCLCENEEFQSNSNRSVTCVFPKKLIISNPVSGQSPPITAAVSWDPHPHTGVKI